MKDKWEYYTPIFECDELNETMLRYAPWSGLRTFAYDLISFMEPRVIVELGSHYGCSAFSFLQAIKDRGYDTEFYAIDTWEGDSYTTYSEVESVFDMYLEIEKKVFSRQNCHKLRMKFNEAIGQFDDNSIDILHIDGSHRYEDVKTDYESWYGKVNNNGIILLHDIGADLVNGEKMGSHYFWKELRDSGAYTLELPFSCGLGIVIKRKKLWDILRRGFSMNHYQDINNLDHTNAKEIVRKAYFKIKGQGNYINELKKQISVLSGHLEKYEKNTAEKELYIRRLERYHSKVEEIAYKAAESEELRKQIKNYIETVESKEQYISELNLQISELNQFADKKASYADKLQKDIDTLKVYASGKERYIVELKDQINELISFAEEKEAYIEELKSQHSELLEYAANKEKYASELKNDVTELNKLMQNKQEYIDELLGQIFSLQDLLKRKENYINELTGTVQKYKETVSLKDSYISELEVDREQLNNFAGEKENYIQELLLQITELNEFADSKERYIQELLKTAENNTHINDCSDN